jgi:hypothetical protein
MFFYHELFPQYKTLLQVISILSLVLAIITFFYVSSGGCEWLMSPPHGIKGIIAGFSVEPFHI